MSGLSFGRKSASTSRRCRKAARETEVRKMIAAYKARVDEDDVAAIVPHLDRTKGEN